VLRLEIVIGVAEEGFRARHEFRIVVAEAKRRALVGRRGHRVYVAVVGKPRVRVVVVHRNLVDFLQQAFVSFLNVGGGIGLRLAERGGNNSGR